MLFQHSISHYPAAIDDERVLIEAQDSLKLKLAVDWAPGDTELFVNGNLETLGRIPNIGFVTVYLRNASVIEAKNRAVTLFYSAYDPERQVLTGIMSSSLEQEIRPAGSDVVFNVVAGHRESLRSAVHALEHYIGTRRRPDPASIEYFAQLLTHEVKRPLPYFVNEPEVAVAGQPVKFHNLTFRLQSWQTITYLWEFGDGQTSTERDPIHVYSEPGKYKVSLTVTNDYGTRTLGIATAVRIVGRPPEKGSVFVHPNVAIADETQVVLSVEGSQGTPDREPVIDYLWKPGDGLEQARNATVTTKFQKGGLFQPLVRRTTPSGAFRWDRLSQPLNVIERDSLWCVQTPGPSNGRAQLEEFMPLSDTWKNSSFKSTFLRAYELGGNNLSVSAPEFGSGLLDSNGGLLPEKTWQNDGSLMEEAETFKAHWFYSISPREMQRSSYDGLTDVWESDPIARFRAWGWQSSRLRWGNAPDVPYNSFYVMFGMSDANDLASSENTFTDIYHSLTQTWETEALPVSVIGNESIHDRPIRWRISPWERHFYAWRSSSRTFNRGYRYDPLVRVWENIGLQKMGVGELNIAEGQTASFTNGIYFFSHDGRIAVYNPEQQLWYEMLTQAGSAPWSNSSLASPNDPNISIRVGTGSESPATDNRVCYIASSYSPAAIAQFNSLTLVSSNLPPRPSGYLWAMGRF